ncbi:MAG: coenzyme F420-0:L-glutamate ligase [Archaeoglobus sp.]|nr:MAG: coenzyme F420-0:L-glutamate ligase [Archaeoglobus sp.]
MPEVVPVKFPLLRKTTLREIAEILSPYVSKGDVVVVSSSIISRAEGRISKLDEYTPSDDAVRLAKKLGEDERFIQAVIEESEEILIDYPFLLTKAKFGNICVNAGIDRSNVERGYILLPPENPDKSADTLRKLIKNVSGVEVGVIITDTNGRCFRKGVTGFAIGCSGIKPLKNWVGRSDLFGNVLTKTSECVADEIAAFANLLMGEGNYSIPAVIFKGLRDTVEFGEGKLSDVYRSREEDIIRRIIREWSLLQE